MSPPTSLLAILILTALSSCADPYHDHRLGATTHPSDLAIEFTIVGDPASNDPLTHSSIYVLEPDRRLRAAVDSSVARHAFPRVAAVLTTQQRNDLVALIHDSGLMSQQTTPGAQAAISKRLAVTAASRPAAPRHDAAAPLYYQVAITEFGITNRFATTPAECPPAVALLTLLVNDAQVQPTTTAPLPAAN